MDQARTTNDEVETNRPAPDESSDDDGGSRSLQLELQAMRGSRSASESTARPAPQGTAELQPLQIVDEKKSAQKSNDPTSQPTGDKQAAVKKRC